MAYDDLKSEDSGQADVHNRLGENSQVGAWLLGFGIFQGVVYKSYARPAICVEAKHGA